MSQDDKSGFNTQWYELWMKQSKEFFDSADKNLKDMFSAQAFARPQDHMQQIQQWVEMMKNQWQFTPHNDNQKAFQDYWTQMTKMCNEATEMMVEQWVKRARENQPIKNVRELYDLWLECCQDVYKRSLQAKSYQDAYGELMNAAFKFWKSYMPKE